MVFVDDSSSEMLVVLKQAQMTTQTPLTRWFVFTMTVTALIASTLVPAQALFDIDSIRAELLVTVTATPGVDFMAIPFPYILTAGFFIVSPTKLHLAPQ